MTGQVVYQALQHGQEGSDPGNRQVLLHIGSGGHVQGCYCFCNLTYFNFYYLFYCKYVIAY